MIMSNSIARCVFLSSAQAKSGFCTPAALAHAMQHLFVIATHHNSFVYTATLQKVHGG